MIGVVILNYGTARETMKCVRSVLNNSCGNKIIVVVDNDSPDDSFSKIENCLILGSDIEAAVKVGEVGAVYFESGVDVYLIRSGNNGGYGAGNNIGIEFLLGVEAIEFLYILNSDVVIDSRSIEFLEDKMRVSPDVQICGSTVRVSGTGAVQCYGGGEYNSLLVSTKFIDSIPSDVIDKESYVEERLSCISGAAMFVRRSFFEKYGLFDERYFLYYEELDLALRMRGEDKLGYCESSVVYHDVGKSIGTSSSVKSKSVLSEYHSFRSKRIFYKKNISSSNFKIYLICIFYVLHRCFHFSFDNARAIVMAVQGK